MSEELIKLAERVEAASGPDLELDKDILRAVGKFTANGLPSWQGGLGWPDFTRCLNYAMSLVPEGMTFSVDQGPAHWIVTGKAKPAGRAQVYRLNPDRDEETGLNAELVEHGFAATPALALVAACLRARATPEHPHEG